MGGPEANSFTCPQCHRECESKFALEKHIFHKHSSNGQQSDQSQSSQSQKPGLNGAEPKLKVFECPYCFTLHANKDRFKKHLGFVPFDYNDCMVGSNLKLTKQINVKILPSFRCPWIVNRWLDRRTQCTARFAAQKRPIRPSCTPTNRRTQSCRGPTSAATPIATSILFFGANLIAISRCTSRRVHPLSPSLQR